MAVLSGSEASPHVKQALELVRCQLEQHGSDYSGEAAVKYAQTCPIDRAALPTLSFRVAAAEVEERINQTAQQLYPQLLGLQARRKFLAEVLRPLASRIGDQQVADAVKKHSRRGKETQVDKSVSREIALKAAEKQRSQTAPRLRPSTAPAPAVRSPRQTDSPGTPPLADSRSARISARTEQNRLAQAAAMLGRRADGTAEPLAPIKERQSSARPSSSMRARTLTPPTPLKTPSPHPPLPRAPRTPSSPVSQSSLRTLLEEEGPSGSDRSGDLAIVRVNNGAETTQDLQGLVAEAGSKRDPPEDGVRLYASECCAASHTGVQTYRDSFRSAANALQDAPKLPALPPAESCLSDDVPVEKPVTPKGKARLSPSQSVDMPTSEEVVGSIELQAERETPASTHALLPARLRESNALVRTKALDNELALIPGGKSPRSHGGQGDRHSPKAFMSPEFVITPSPLRKASHGRAAEKAAAASQVSKQNLIVRWQQQQQLADVTLARLELREQTLLETHRQLLHKMASLEEYAAEARSQQAEHMRELARMEVAVRTREQQYTAAETALRQRIQTLQLTEQELLDADNQVQLRLQEVKQREEALLAAQLRLNDEVASNATRGQALDMLCKKLDAQEKALAERERKVAQREQQISLTGSNLSRWYQEMAEIQASKEFAKESAS